MDTHEVYYSLAAPATLGDMTLVQNLPNVSSTWDPKGFQVAALTGQATVYVGFRYMGLYADNWYLDDICISEGNIVPTPAPTNSPTITNTETPTNSPTITTTPAMYCSAAAELPCGAFFPITL